MRNRYGAPVSTLRIAEPSTADAQITEKLKDSLSLLDIRLLDHLIIGDGLAVSLAERGYL